MNHITFLDHNNTIIKSKVQGETILECALQSAYPIFHECGGRARCTTCRIQVINGSQNLSERNEREKLLAKRKGWDNSIRLACQTEVFGNIEVKKIIQSKEEIFSIMNDSKQTVASTEKWMTVLFIDIKGFTEFSEKNYPHDIVYVLNRFFTMTTEIILNNGGTIDKYIGDAIMAYFDPGDKERDECIMNSLRACFRILDKMKAFNEFLEERFQSQFFIRIGLHSGSVVIGEVGHPISKQVTIFGDTVNVASRIESLNKSTGTHLLVSNSTIASIKDKLIIGKKFKVKLRGKTVATTLSEVLGFKEIDFAYSLQSSLDKVLDSSDNFSERFYSKLLTKRPDFKQLFANTNMKEQGNKLTNMIQYAIDRLAIFSTIKEEIHALGSKHVDYGVKDQDYIDTGEVLLNTIQDSLRDEWNADLANNWKLAIQTVADAMMKKI